MNEINYDDAHIDHSPTAFPHPIRGIIADLRSKIEQYDANIKSSKELISELARILEEKICDRNEISRKINEILKDKIREWKITEKWIEECLPQKHKRKYNKSEIGSLSTARKQNTTVLLKHGDVILKEAEVGEDSQKLASPPIQLIERSDTDNLAKNDSEPNLLDFEFSMIFRDLRQYMIPLYHEIGDGGNVWFSGIIDKNTGKVIHAQLRRRSCLQ